MLLRHFEAFERFVVPKSVLVFVQRGVQDISRGVKESKNVFESILAML